MQVRPTNFSTADAPQTRTVWSNRWMAGEKRFWKRSLYITKAATGQFSVFVRCPPLGCSVQWQDGKKAFVCPCHSAQYEPDGKRTGGPAPRGMDTLESKVVNGRLLVRYQYFRQLVSTKEVIG